MYKKAVYKYNTYCGTYTDKEKVISDFMQDISNIVPVSVRKNDTRIFICFTDSKYHCLYTLPLSYEKYVSKYLNQ